MTRLTMAAPLRAQLPSKRAATLAAFDLELRVATPIFGGAPVPRDVDRIDVIRPASIRGQLRFWWRALHAHQYDAATLYQFEASLWGGPSRDGDREKIGRSRVEMRVDVLEHGRVEPARFDGPEGYATFPGRAQRDGTPAASIRFAGTRFRLRLRTPIEHRDAVRDTVRAWVLFGGYGGRTRRGLGCLTILGETDEWLPKWPSPHGIEQLFGRDIFAAPGVIAGQTPLLAGAKFFSPFTELNATSAWSKAIGWLVEFRQGHTHRDGARQPPPPKQPEESKPSNRPSISNWPEPDKIRHLSRAALPWAHPPKYNDTPAWPRAGFGLPIIGQFQAKSRNDKPWEHEVPPTTEPEDYRIGWRERTTKQARERLASPLILKAMPLRSDDKFSPIALWLNRAHPDGEVVLQRKDGSVVEGSAAPFERLLAPGDVSRFRALEGHDELRHAFFTWLASHGREQPRAKSNGKSGNSNPHQRKRSRP